MNTIERDCYYLIRLDCEMRALPCGNINRRILIRAVSVIDIPLQGCKQVYDLFFIDIFYNFIIMQLLRHIGLVCF